MQAAIFFGNLFVRPVVSYSSSGHRPPAALLSNIGPARLPSPPSKRAGPFCVQIFKKVRIMKSFRAIILAVAASVAITGCATVKGLGRDIESVGQAGSDAIN